MKIFIDLKSSTKSKRTAAGHLVTQLKKRVMNAKHESHVESTNSLNATGKLFGHQLGSICDDESKPPKSIMVNIFRCRKRKLPPQIFLI